MASSVLRKLILNRVVTANAKFSSIHHVEGNTLFCVHLRSNAGASMLRSFNIVHGVRAVSCFALISLRKSRNMHLPQNALSSHRTIGTYSVSDQNLLNIAIPTLLNCRSYAKGKGKGKDKAGKKGSSKHVELSPEELNAVIDSDKFHDQLDGQVEHLKNEFLQQLSLRSSLGTFDSLAIETADGKFPLIQLGQVAQKGQSSVVINMAASPQYIPQVKTALINSMGLNAQQDGTTLFVNVPKVTKEHRESMTKTAKGMCDKTKVKLRDIQSKYLQTLKKVKNQHSEDLIFNVQQYIQEEVKNYVDKIDSLTASKQKELLGGK